MLPSELGNLTEMTKLDLRNNRLSGPIPSELGNLTKIWRMFLAGPNHTLTGCIPAALYSRTLLTEDGLWAHDFDALGLPFCGGPTAIGTATATPTAGEFTPSGSGTSSDPYIISDPTNVYSHPIRSHDSDRIAGRESAYFKWNVGDRAGSWIVAIDTTPTDHDFDLLGRDDRGTGWDDRGESGDGDDFKSRIRHFIGRWFPRSHR